MKGNDSTVLGALICLSKSRSVQSQLRKNTVILKNRANPVACKQAYTDNLSNH